MAENKLKKEISGLTALTIVVGTVIGAGVFFKPTAVFTASGTAGMGLLAWFVGGIIAIAGGLTVAEIGTMIPKTGGIMVFLEEIFGRPFGFLAGWAQMLVYFPGNIAALCIIFGTQAVNLLGVGDNWIVPISLGVIILLTIINAMGTQATSYLQNASTMMKLIPLTAIILGGLFFNHEPLTVRLIPVVAQNHSFWSSFGTTLLATVFAYDGWINVSALAGEMKNPSRDLPRAIVGGLSLVTAIYLVINVAYLQVLPPEQLAATATPAASVAQLLFPNFGGRLVTIGILISVFGGANGYLMASWRIPYAMGIKNYLPKSSWFTHLNSRTNAATHGGILMLGLVSLMIVSGQFDQLTDLSVFVIWIFNTLTFFGIFVLRKKYPDAPRAYRVPGYPFIPLIAIVGGFFIVFSTLFSQPLNAGLGLLLTGLGWPIYLYQNKKNQ